MKKKTLLIVAICVVVTIGLVALGICSDKEPDTNIPEITTASQDTTTENVQETTPEETTEEPELVYFETDEIVNDFFVKYNVVSNNPIEAENISKGNIRTKACISNELYYMEVINATEFLSVSISMEPENEYTVLKEIFTTCLSIHNVDSESIEKAWNDIHSTGYMVQNYSGIENVSIDYSPSVKQSWGYTDLQMELIFELSTDNEEATS